MLKSNFDGGVAPKPYDIEGCEYCDGIVKDRIYRGKLREYRTEDGRTMPQEDAVSGLRLSRTMDFFTDTGAIFRGGEITSHSQRVHDAISNVTNLISFTVASTGLKRYVLTQEKSASELITSKILSDINMPVTEITKYFIEVDDFGVIEQVLGAARTSLPPERIEQVVYKIVRNPKIAQLIKEKQKYICEVCKRPPFIQKNGMPYAEADHIEPLGLGGLDNPDNMRCLCSQCHAIITHGSDEVIRQLLEMS